MRSHYFPVARAVHTALGPPPDLGDSVLAGEMTARVVLVLARRPYTAAFASICEHVGDLILEEVSTYVIETERDDDGP